MILHFMLLTALALLPIFLWNQIPYQNVNLPFFSLPAFFFIACFILHNLFLLLSIIHFGKRNSFQGISMKMKKQYGYSFILVFCILAIGTVKQHLFLGGIMEFLLFSNQFFLYEEVAMIDDKSTLFLNIPLLWNLYFSAIAITSFLLNV